MIRLLMSGAVVLWLAGLAAPQSQRFDVAKFDRERALKSANQYLSESPITITASASARSAGGPHDFFSEGDYWWPDPQNPEGPYIQRDGMTNPDNFTDHRRYLMRLSVQLPALVAAWKLTGDRRYAAHSAKHLRAWFLDEKTRMNPSLKFAQAIKGRVTGRGIGIIDTIHLVEVARAIESLEGSTALSKSELQGVKQWFTEYLTWMTTHPYGIEEREAKNNHGTCWVMQVAAFARLTGAEELLSYCRERFKTVLLPSQMAADGSFPQEMRRTKPYGYALFNLDAMATICLILSTAQDNLWTFELADGRGMRKAMAFMAPYIRDKKSWPLKPDVMYDQEWPMRHCSLFFAGQAFDNRDYIELWKTLKADSSVEEVVRNFFIRQPVLWENARSQGGVSASVKRSEFAAPRVFLLDGKHLQATRERLRKGDQTLAPAMAKLERDAQEALTSGPFSVVSKEATPPSGDKHDYMSRAPYWWPDPSKPNGLPYIRRDGERNPEINKITDHRVLDQMVAAVETLALAYYLKGDEAYADKAARLLRVWFLDPATRMNPHLEYGQGIPGINTGRGIGLIETRGLTRVVDAIGLLAGAKAWSQTDQRGLQDWFARFLRWMLESKHGRDEAAAKNNHGTYYDLQVVSFAMFLGRRELATNTLKTARQKRIAAQIEPDGRQPLELDRTRAWSYSVGNLDGLMSLARLGKSAGVDLWNYRTVNGRGIRKALDFLTAFATGEKKWAHQQLGEWQPQTLFPLLRRAAIQYPDKHYHAVLSKLPEVNAADRGNLLLPIITDKKQAQQ
ncbi:MAG TPA: alginate lyase family protein [Blastocatellia bacterium]|nr:alginate lyase family protein [Blastocatellia bacterium]